MAPRPSAERIRVALAALEDDAARWARAADDLGRAAAAARAETLDPSAFSFVGGPMAEAYARLQGTTATLLTQGAENCAAIAAALRASAAAYAAEERAGIHRLRDVY